jgi:Whirly transcription factor
MNCISLSFLLALLVQQISSFRLLQSSVRSTRTFAVPTVEVVGERVFASYVVYKTKAAVSLKIIPPTFQPAGVNAKKLSREGGLFFEFALAAGPKEYDWLKKGTFFLSAAECAEMLLLSQGKQGMELFHDPNMGAANSGNEEHSALLLRE